ncbi:MAG TPA: transcription termination factor Rho [Gemmatimonadales bacterium]|nr:transcription termination factor Rho [Gemmatimonadales bacterium]
MSAFPPPLGVLDLPERGAGFLRRRSESYLPSPSDVQVPARLAQDHGLRTGDEISGETGSGGNGRGRGGGATQLTRILAVNGQAPEGARHRPAFASLPAIHPNVPLRLDCGMMRRGQPDPTNRVIDLLCPLGKGQRALVVAPAKAGKTTILQCIAEGLTKNYPAMTLFILLVDERPEEVTEMEMAGFGEVIASSFDCPADQHVAVAELTLERARRRVEEGGEVTIILDSITRLARAFNAAERGSGRTLSGGLDATSLERPKRFLGSARQVDPGRGGGSLTIVGTALVDTGSKMDQVIYEEFKGTGNSELVLSRELAERRIFPAVDFQASGTRREELLLSPELLTATRTLRSQWARLPSTTAMEQTLALLKRTRSNDQVPSALNPVQA